MAGDRERVVVEVKMMDKGPGFVFSRGTPAASVLAPNQHI